MLVDRIDNRMFFNRQRGGLGQGHGQRKAFGFGSGFQRRRIDIHRHPEQRHGKRIFHVVGHGFFHRGHRAAFTRHLENTLGRGFLHIAVQHIGGDDHAIRPRAGDTVQINPVGAGQLPRIGGGRFIFWPGRRGRPMRHRRNMGFRFGGAGGNRFCFRLTVVFTRAAAGGFFAIQYLLRLGNQIGNRLPHRHGGINFSHRPGQIAFTEHFHIHDGFISFHLRDHIATLNLVTDFFFPAHHHAFFHGVGKLGH